MKSVQILCLFILVPMVKGYFNVIQCYVCDDCDVFDDCLLQSCPQITTSTTTTQTTFRTADPPSVRPTVTPSPKPTPTVVTTTFATSRATTTTTTTTAHTTTSKKTTLPPATSDTTWINTESVTKSTDISETEGITTAEDATTTTETEISSSTTSETTERTTDDSTLEPEQSTENDVNGLEAAYSNKSVLLHWPSVSFHCYSIDIVENNKKKKRRGCVKVPVNKSGCTVLKEKFGCSAKNCKLCSFDRCNSGRALEYSTLALISSIVFGFIFK